MPFFLFSDQSIALYLYRVGKNLSPWIMRRMKRNKQSNEEKQSFGISDKDAQDKILQKMVIFGVFCLHRLRDDNCRLIVYQRESL